LKISLFAFFHYKDEFMSAALESLIACGTKLWLDSIDPDLVRSNRAAGATGATSNPIIVADLLKTGRFDTEIERFAGEGLSDEEIAWRMTDQLVQNAQDVFLPVWEQSGGNDGYVSFELDPLLEDASGPPHDERVRTYIESGKEWAAGRKNRMIKVPATPAGLDALEELAAAGVTLNVTLIFTSRQYEAARDAVWRGAQRRSSLDQFKSVYSIFVSRVDVYTARDVPQLTAGQGQTGIVNAKRIWQQNRDFWQSNPTPLNQEMIFASTGVKNPSDPAWKYVGALAGSDIQTNPPATNDAVAASNQTFTNQIADAIPAGVAADIDEHVDFAKLEEVLMQEGLKKFADPQKALLALIAERRASLST